jgi:hypothetical protein
MLRLKYFIKALDIPEKSSIYVLILFESSTLRLARKLLAPIVWASSRASVCPVRGRAVAGLGDPRLSSTTVNVSRFNRELRELRKAASKMVPGPQAQTDRNSRPRNPFPCQLCQL